MRFRWKFSGWTVRTRWGYLEFLDASFRVSIWSFWRFHLEFKAFGNKLRESTWMIRLDWHRPSECRRGNIFDFWEIVFWENVFDSKVIKLSRICLFLFGRTTLISEIHMIQYQALIPKRFSIKDEKTSREYPQWVSRMSIQYYPIENNHL